VVINANNWNRSRWLRGPAASFPRPNLPTHALAEESLMNGGRDIATLGSLFHDFFPTQVHLNRHRTGNGPVHFRSYLLLRPSK
jgi:hypothetical protein